MEDRQTAFSRKIVWLSFVLAVAVVVRHTVNIDVYRLQPGMFFYWFQRYVSVCTDIVVPVFFMISGYLFYRNFDYSCCKRKWKTRFHTLVIPYVIWNLVAYFYYVAITSIPFVAKSMNKPIEPLGVSSVLSNALWGYHNVTWFIRYLIVFVFVTPLFYFVMKRKCVSISVVAGMLVMNGFVGWGYWTYASIFLSGGVMSLFWREIVEKNKNNSAMATVVAYLLLTTMLELTDCIAPIRNYIYPLLRISQGIAIWWLLIYSNLLERRLGGQNYHSRSM